MKATATRCALLLFCSMLVVGVCARWTSGQSEPIPCCGAQAVAQPQEAVAAEAAATRATHACPRYVAMNFGSYCTYYAQLCPGCQPVSYNSTSCMLGTAGNCMDTVAPVCEGCQQLRAEQRAADDPGALGYDKDIEGNPQRQKELEFAKVEKSVVGKVKVKELDTFVIKFLGGPDSKTEIFAQIFVVKVDPQDKEDKERPTVYLGSGIEIVAPEATTPVLDLTASPGAVTCIGGRPFAYQYHHGDMSVEVIVFKDNKNKHSCP